MGVPSLPHSLSEVTKELIGGGPEDVAAQKCGPAPPPVSTLWYRRCLGASQSAFLQYFHTSIAPGKRNGHTALFPSSRSKRVKEPLVSAPCPQRRGRKRAGSSWSTSYAPAQVAAGLCAASCQGYTGSLGHGQSCFPPCHITPALS